MESKRVSKDPRKQKHCLGTLDSNNNKRREKKGGGGEDSKLNKIFFTKMAGGEGKFILDDSLEIILVSFNRSKLYTQCLTMLSLRTGPKVTFLLLEAYTTIRHSISKSTTVV